MKITVTCYDEAMNRLWKRSGNLKKNLFQYHIAPFPLSILEKPLEIKKIKVTTGYAKRKQKGAPFGGITTEIEVIYDGNNYTQIQFAKYSQPTHMIEYEDAIKTGFLAKEVAMTKPSGLLQTLTNAFIIILLIGTMIVLSQVSNAVNHWQQPVNKSVNLAYSACISFINQSKYIAQLDNTTLAFCRSKT